MNKITLATLREYKQQKRPVSMLTCYDYSTAILLQQSGIDSLLVGDSLSQVVLGHPNTLSATMDAMILLTAAVRRGAPDVYLIGDMPFLSYQVNFEQAVVNAGRFLTEAGCDAVKLEVDHRHIELVERLTAAGIPVMAHLGHRPQSVLQSTKIVETRSLDSASRLILTGLDMIKAGASLLLLECVTSKVAAALTEKSPVPVIGCGSGPYCDGQVLVLHEVLSLPGAQGARFCRSYAHIGEQIRNAARAYIDEVKNKEFPDEEHSYHMNAADGQQFQQWLREFDSQTGR